MGSRRPGLNDARPLHRDFSERWGLTDPTLHRPAPHTSHLRAMLRQCSSLAAARSRRICRRRARARFCGARARATSGRRNHAPAVKTDRPLLMKEVTS